MKFRFVDRIVSWKAYESIVGVKTVSFEEYSLKKTFGEEPRLPETLLLESFLQLGNWLIMLSSGFEQMGLVARMSRVEFLGAVGPGETVRLEVRLDRRREDGCELHGRGLVGGRKVLEGSGCLAVPAALGDYRDPDDVRTLFSEIGPPLPAETSSETAQ